MIRNIIFTYADQVDHDPAKENELINEINDWLHPFEKEFNENEAIAVMHFDKGYQQQLSFDNIQEDFKNRLYSHLGISQALSR
jgi:hypothetical protein